jgi:hypothetical protein
MRQWRVKGDPLVHAKGDPKIEQNPEVHAGFLINSRFREKYRRYIAQNY